MKIREALRDMQLRLTELEEYLGISRPTLYKFVEYYENDKRELINPIVRDLFKYIEKNKGVTKKEVISYIANLGKVKDDELIGNLMQFIEDAIAQRQLTDYEKDKIKKIIKGETKK